jgi:predicted ATP-binding protein involved in virulence
MITNLHIENFKCFVKQDFSLGKLTVLSGPNGSGKSSVLQSFVLAKFAASIGKREGFIPLNENHVLELGAVGDVLSQSPSNNTIQIKITTDSPSSTIITADASPAKLEDRFLTIRIEGEVFPKALQANETVMRLSHVHYHR